jgi:ATP-dependent RNA helicase RhlE
MKFEQYQLHPAIQQSLAEMGFKKPTDIQYKAMPSILKGEDVMAIAQTGTGKTAAFAIPIIEHLLRKKRMHGGVRALVLAPTRELVLQTLDVFESIGQHTNFNPVALVGGLDREEQLEALSENVDVLVATPGRLFEMLQQQKVNISHTEILVLDESDQMMALGFLSDVKAVKKRLPRQHQTLFFSATINESIKEIAYALVRNPIRIQVSPENKVSKNVAHSVLHMTMDEKRFFLERIIKEHPDSKILVFCRTKVRVDRVQQAMARVGLSTTIIHGGKEQEERNLALKDFASGHQKVLIATDVSARGIDIKNVEYVVNYDIPDVAENYVHRVGRTGRGMEKGFAISFCSEEEKTLLLEVEKFIGSDITVLTMDKLDFQATLDFSTEAKTDMKAIQAMIAENETFLKAKKKKKK